MKKINAEPIHPNAMIGHVHLKVSNIERSINFYRDILGFELMNLTSSAAFLSAGGYHHHIGLNTWESKGKKGPPEGSTGLYHFAILMPNRKELARELNRLISSDWPIDGASDHGVSEAIYLRDPDGNGIEIYADRPRELWPRNSDGDLLMLTKPLDIEDLMAELKEGLSLKDKET